MQNLVRLVLVGFGTERKESRAGVDSADHGHSAQHEGVPASRRVRQRSRELALRTRGMTLTPLSRKHSRARSMSWLSESIPVGRSDFA
jgi:hypothetical protein